jgi:uncharacterized protein with von Willebrand factor type A (vWA) domain
MFSMLVDTIEGRAEFMALLAGRSIDAPAPLAGRQIVRVRGGQVVARRSAPAVPVMRELDTVALSLTALAAAFVERLRAVGGDAFTDEQAAQFATALHTDMPRSRRALYGLSCDTFLSGRQHMDLFNEVFADVFGAQRGMDRYRVLASEPAKAVAGMR